MNPFVIGDAAFRPILLLLDRPGGGNFETGDEPRLWSLQRQLHREHWNHPQL